MDKSKNKQPKTFEQRAQRATQSHWRSNDVFKTDSDDDVDEFGNPIQRRHMGGGGGRPHNPHKPVETLSDTDAAFVEAHMILDVTGRNTAKSGREDKAHPLGLDRARAEHPDVILGALGTVVEVTFVPQESPIAVRTK